MLRSQAAAAGGAMPAIQAMAPAMNRREIIAGAGIAALALPAIAAPAIGKVHDPLLEAINDLKAADAAFNALPSERMSDKAFHESAIEATYGPPYDRLSFDPPAATTRAGALAALRLAHEWECYDDLAANMVAAALEFFEGEKPA